MRGRSSRTEPNILKSFPIFVATYETKLSNSTVSAS
jgi:hypothetical protein